MGENVIKTAAEIFASASVAGGKEADGPIGELFDLRDPCDRFGMKTWEKAESEMQRLALNTALAKAEMKAEEIGALFAGDLEEDVIKKERERAVFACLQELPLQYRQVLTLAYFDSFSISEICAIMSRSSKQVYNLLNRAKTSLKTSLEKVGITYEDI